MILALSILEEEEGEFSFLLLAGTKWIAQELFLWEPMSEPLGWDGNTC